MGRQSPAESDAELHLSHLATEAGFSLTPRLLTALALIQDSAAFEGDGDLAAAHLALRDLLRDVQELRERIELTLDQSPLQSEQILRALLDAR